MATKNHREADDSGEHRPVTFVEGLRMACLAGAVSVLLAIGVLISFLGWRGLGRALALPWQ